MSKYKINYKGNIIYILDDHIIYSKYIGKNDYGHDEYSTERTKLGENIYRLKYKDDIKTTNYILEEIEKNIHINNINNINCIVSAPFTEERKIQPVVHISKKLSEKLNLEYKNVLIKNSNIKAKDVKDSKNFIKGIECIADNLSGNILLIDDLYGTGNTIKECIDQLKNKNKNIKMIYTICLTKTKKK